MTETQRMIDLLNAGFPDLTALTPAEARAAADARVRVPGNLDDVAETSDHLVGTNEIPVRLYIPHELRADSPVTIYAHGGGFLHGSIASHDGFCRRWARGTGTIVASVDYRLAPDHAAGSGVDDVLDVVEWITARGLGRGVVLAGDSAGANLAAVSALELRDRGDSPARAQVLLYPMLDPTMSSASYRTRAEGTFVTARLIAYYWRAYLGDPIDPAAVTPRIDPSRASRHDGLPPTIVVTAGLDPLCDEGHAYARLLSGAGVRTTLRNYPEQFHGFFTIPNYSPSESAAQILWSDLAHAVNTTQESAS